LKIKRVSKNKFKFASAIKGKDTGAENGENSKSRLQSSKAALVRKEAPSVAGE
jgi:hypothetical protein